MKLTKEEILERQSALTEWKLVYDENAIQKEFVFLDFASALAFVNKVGEIAESVGHHPDIFLYDYKRVTITLSTHDVGGLSENDFIIATKIDAI